MEIGCSKYLSNWKEDWPRRKWPLAISKLFPAKYSLLNLRRNGPLNTSLWPYYLKPKPNFTLKVLVNQCESMATEDCTIIENLRKIVITNVSQWPGNTVVSIQSWPPFPFLCLLLSFQMPNYLSLIFLFSIVGSR